MLVQTLGEWSKTRVRLEIATKHYPLRSGTELIDIARWSFVECLKHYQTRDDFQERKSFAAYLERQGYSQREANMIAELCSI